MSSIPTGEFITHSAEETFELAYRIGEAITQPTVFLLEGDLGAGKTVFAKGIGAGLEIDPAEVNSPTFTLVNYYDGRMRLYHLDLYRIKDPRELVSIGWDDILAQRALLIVEWPDRAPALMPHGHIPISLSHVVERPDHRILYAGGHT